MLHLFWPPKSPNLHFKRGYINVSSNQQFVISQNDQQADHSKGIIMTIMMSRGDFRRAQTARRGRTSRVCGFSDVGDNWGVNGSIANFKSEYFIVFFHGKMAQLLDLNVLLKDVLGVIFPHKGYNTRWYDPLLLVVFIGGTSRELVIVLEVEVGSVWLGIDSVWNWDRGGRS